MKVRSTHCSEISEEWYSAIAFWEKAIGLLLEIDRAIALSISVTFTVVSNIFAWHCRLVVYKCCLNWAILSWRALQMCDRPAYLSEIG